MSTPSNPWGAPATAVAYPQQPQQQAQQAQPQAAWQAAPQQGAVQYQQQPAQAAQQPQAAQPQPLQYTQYTTAAADPSPWTTAQYQQQPAQLQQPQQQHPQPQQQQSQPQYVTAQSQAQAQTQQYVQAQQPATQAQQQPAQQQYAAYIAQPAQGNAGHWSGQVAVTATAPASTQPAAVYVTMETPDRKLWVGTVTQLIPPNYGIVDGDAFYVTAVVQGRVPQLGERVRCDAVPNTDGGQYKWRCNSVALEAGQTATIVYGTPMGPAVSAAGTAAGAAAAGAAGARPAGARGSRFSLSKLGGEEATKVKFNSAAPPTVQYMADAALAVAAESVNDDKVAAAPPINRDPAVIASKAALVYSKPPPQLSEEEKKRSEEAVKNFVGDPSGIGAKLLSKMGFGAAEGSKGGLGRNEQGIAAPVDPVATKGNRGLGFAFGAPRDRGDHGERGGRGRDRDTERGGGGYRDRERGRERERDRERDRGRKRSPSESRSRSRSSSSSRSRSRSPTGRYDCKIPKFWTSERVRGLSSISKRYKDMYIPSDFCYVDASWVESLPDHAPLDITCPFAFNITKPGAGTDTTPPISTAPSAELASPEGGAKRDEGGLDSAKSGVDSALNRSPGKESMSEAEKASGRRWSAKVMVFSGIASESLVGDNIKTFQHPLKKLSFLVGQTAKKEYFTLGGAWDPVDGPHPETDPSVLIRTAIRTFKVATGVDLSSCTQWIKFAELTYARCTSKKDASSASSQDHTVLFIVDAWSITKANTSALDALTNAKLAQGEEEEARRAVDEAEASAKKAEKLHLEVAAAHPEGQRDTSIDEDLNADPSSMTVAQLQAECGKHNLDTKWDPLKDGKKALEKRLQDFLEKRRAERNIHDMGLRLVQEAKASAENAIATAAKARARYDAAKMAAREGRRLLKEQLMTECLDVTPGKVLLAHKANVGPKYLDSLLNYTDDDTKEGSFEVALFAELFKEMLQTRFGRALLRALPVIATVREKEKEKEREKEREKESKSSGSRRSSKSSRSDRDRDRERDKEKEREAEKEREKAMEKEREAEKAKAKEQDKEKEKNVEGEAADGKEERKDEDEIMEDNEKPEEIDTDEKMNDKEKEAEKEEKEEEKKEEKIEATEEEYKPEAADDVDESKTTGERQKRAAEETSAAEDSKRAKAELSSPPPAVPPPAPAAPAGGVQDALALACRFWDFNCAGYIDSDDLEELLYMVAPDVSRRQVQSLVDGATSKRSKLSYLDLAAALIPPAQPVRSLRPTGSIAVDRSSPVETCTGFIMVDGSLVDVASLRARLARSEAARQDAELKAQQSERTANCLQQSEAGLKEQLSSLNNELEQLRSRVAMFSSDQTNLQSTFLKTMADVESAQTMLSSAMAHLQYLGKQEGERDGAQDRLVATDPHTKVRTEVVEGAGASAAASESVEPAVQDAA